MSARCRILIAKQSSRGLSALLKGLDPRQADVIAFYDVPPRLDRKFGETDVDICLIDLKMLQRVLKSHPDCVSRIRRTGVVALILNERHLSKARQFSDKVDGFVLVDHLLDFINESLLLAQERHCVVPSGMLSRTCGLPRSRRFPPPRRGYSRISPRRERIKRSPPE